MSVLDLALSLSIFMLIGFLLRKIHILPDGFETHLAKLLFVVFIPFLIINSYLVEFSWDDLNTAAPGLIIGIVVLAISFLIGEILFLLLKRSNTGKVVRFSMMISNFTFFGMPIIEALYGSQGLFYYTLLILPIRLIYYPSAGFLLEGKVPGGIKVTLKHFFSLPVISTFIGLGLYISQIQLPSFLITAISSLSSAAFPLGLILCGMIIANVNAKSLFKRPLVLLITLLRLVVVPGIVLFILLPFNIDPLIVKCAVFYSAMPVATLIPTYVMQYIPDTESSTTAGVSVFLSTILSIATVPLWAMIIQNIY